MLVALLSVLAMSTTSQAAESPVLVPSNAETVPVNHSGDAMDDPAIWVHPTDSTKSLLIGNDKGGGFETYDLQGNLVERIGGSFFGNVDVKQDVTINGIVHDLVGIVQKGVRFYTVNPDTRQLSQITENNAPIGVNGEGFCMYQSPTTQKVYGISVAISGTVNEFELTDPDADGLLSSTTVRTFSVGSEAEGCVVDDESGALYISEENVALWRYSAEPNGDTSRTAVDTLTSAGGHLINDIEGVTIAEQAGGKGFIMVSAQGTSDPTTSYFSVYRREGSNDFVKTFRVSDGTSSDDCDHTDGVTATTANLGAAFPRGMFVCQDNNNDAPGLVGNQDLKMVRLENIVNLDGNEEPPPPPPPPPPSTISWVGQATSNVNSTAFTVQVPASVHADDALLLFASAGSDRVLTGPGTGWVQIGRVVDGSHATTVWRRRAVAGDAGTTVRLTSGTTFTKVGLTLAAYRGVNPTNPLVSITGAGEPGSTGSHTTPLVANSTNGAWRVSYWSDKTGGTTGWTGHAGETVRATSFGSGGGRVGTLLTDLPSPLTAGAPANTGGVNAVANASATTATMWTVLLRPAADTPPTNQPPTAVLHRTCSDLTCDFDATDSTDPDDGIDSWAWDFGDGDTSTDSTVEHVYDDPGTYTVKLTVTDDTGVSDDAEQTFTLGSPPPPPAISFVGRATSNVNSTAFTVQVPATVQAGDALLLFASQGGTSTLTGPGTGWTQIGRVADGEVTTVWRKVATAADAGSTVRLANGTTYMKTALTLAAYRGTDTTNPVASITGAGEPGSATSHTSPSVANGTSGAWRLSYWSDKNSSTTTWTAPAGEQNRATSYGSGGGRVSALLTDSGAALTAGSPANTGSLVARANAAATTATMWTVLLTPKP